VRDVDINAVELDPIIRQIIAETSESLSLSSLTEEIGKQSEATASNVTRAMVDAEKVVCKILVSSLGCDGLGILNGRQECPPGSDMIALS
jgi:hypothetical protein